MKSIVFSILLGMLPRTLGTGTKLCIEGMGCRPG